MYVMLIKNRSNCRHWNLATRSADTDYHCVQAMMTQLTGADSLPE